jgi:hypothetical protein
MENQKIIEAGRACLSHAIFDLMPETTKGRACIDIYVLERRSKLLNWREHLYGILRL